MILRVHTLNVYYHIMINWTCLLLVYHNVLILSYFLYEKNRHFSKFEFVKNVTQKVLK
jgi:hypothetical protein